MYTTIPLDQVDAPKVDVRTFVADGPLRELAESIRSIGLLQPIGVVADGERYRVLFGNRRFLAHRWLGLPEISCRVLTTEEAERLAAATAENVVREGLTPVEEARAIRQMVDQQGRSVRQVSGALGKSEAWVRGRLDILHWPEPILMAVAAGELSPSVARELVAVEDDAWRAVYLRAAIENGVTALQAKMWRGEWEAHAAVQGGAPPPVAGESPVPSVVIPKALCGLCKVDFRITELTFVRVCGSCGSEILRAPASPVGGVDGGGR